MIEQQSSFSSGLTVNRTSNDHLWLEVAKRYQQIIEKDIKLRYPSQPVVPIKTFQTDCNIPNPVENTQFGNDHPLPPSALPVAYQKKERLNLATRPKEIDPGTFPRIVDVFSLNPSLPAKYFRDNVAVRLTPDGLIAEPVCRRSSENVVPKQSAIPGHSFTRRAKNLQEKRNLVDYDKNFMQDDNFQTSQCVDILDYFDIEAGQNVNKIGSLTEGNPRAIEMNGGCEFQDAKEEKTCDREAMVIVNKKDVPEQICSDVNARGKRRKRKRRAIFGLRRNKRRHLMGNLNTVKENNQHELEGELIRDGTKMDKSLQVECYSALEDANAKSEDINTDEKCNSSKKQGQEKIQDRSILSKQSDEKNITISFASKTELKCPATTVSENLKDTFVSSLHGYNIRQSKIFDLKAKLAKQEQELRNLKQRKDFENVEKEDCPFDGRPVEDNGSTLLKYETIFDFSHPIDVTFSTQNEKNDDFNLGKIEDLIDTFQKEIKSFRTLDTELYPTRRQTDYDHLQTRTYVVGGNDKRVFTGINNQMRLAPENFASKEEFLFQLGLLRI